MTARIIMKMHVAHMRLTSPHVLHLHLKHPLRSSLPHWSAGAHVDLHLPDGRVRQYSLCGDPEQHTHYEIAIKREEQGRGGSRWLHDHVTVGSELHISAPRNSLPLDERGDRYIFVAGGIGITPLISMARTLRRRGKTFAFHCCAPSARLTPLLAELKDICGPRLHCWFSKEGTRFDPAILPPYDPGIHAYVCGPQRLLDAVQAALTAWPEDGLHVEAFDMTVDENFKPEPFEATIASTGETLLVPATKSLLEVLRENGFVMPSSCQIGVCGSCECGYRNGTVIHRDKILPTSKRQDRLMPCVSRARVSVTLDL
ncbi:2Fe-2S iron-sulfur cluster-binding protein [Hyphomicrobium sp.]|jgi:vanillate O-demethylase ferredoxin subunit|uniref:PDR/VanB family oxidoreductase n=1 Tax=Hyphomicrobium sp. TaxID=82 RepID=UPI0035637D13